MSNFETGQLLEVDWESDGIICGGHTDSKGVAFICDDEYGAMVAYEYIYGGVCVGHVPYSALSVN